ESIVVRVTLPPSKETVCTRVVERALLMLSLSSIAVGRSGEPSRLMVSLLSLIVGPFLGAGALAEVGAVAPGCWAWVVLGPSSCPSSQLWSKMGQQQPESLGREEGTAEGQAVR